MRICLFAGPGAGKTTLAHWLTGQLKEAHQSVEYVGEWIKRWAYQKRVPKGWDQKKVFDRQMEAELNWLQNGVDHVVTDGPVLMQIAYMERAGCRYLKPCLELAKLYEEEYPSVNIFLCRDGIEYKQNGRYENHEAAKVMDDMIRRVLDEHAPNYVELRTLDRGEILSEVFMRMRCGGCG